MSNSNLVNKIYRGSENSNARRYPITKITVHHAAGKLTLDQFWSVMNSRDVSWNYAISHDGKIGLFIEEKSRAWTSSSPDNDHRAITIEVSNSSSTDSSWAVPAAAYQALLNLCEDICRRNNIKQIQFTGTPSGNLTQHNFFTDTNCPGPFLKARFPDIQNQINQRLGSASNLSYVTNPDTLFGTAAGAIVSGTTIPVAPLLDYTQITPFLVTLDRSATNVNYKTLKASGVVGVLLEAGYLYDSIHLPVTFRNPRIESQARAVADAGLPYGLWFYGRARTLSEAGKEMEALRQVIYKLPPLLGVWARIQFASSNATNDSIMRKYQRDLEHLGLVDMIGVYCNKTQLSKFSWQAFSNRWYLWFDNHTSNLDEFNKLLDPSFFLAR